MRRSPKDTEDSIGMISRRGLILGTGMAGFAVLLGSRMRQLQVNEADQFRLLAEENRINIRLLPPPRGQVFDRNGLLIAGNQQNYRVTIIRDEVDDPKQTLSNLSRLIPLSQQDIDDILEEMSKRSRLVPVTVADRLSWEDVSQVAVNAPALPGITPEFGLSRIYPRGDDFAHIIGYVGPVSDYDLSRIEDPDPLLQIPKFQIGKTGIENKLEASLRGKAGTKRIEVNAVGRVMRELGRDEATKGDTVQLTIDTKLQNFVVADYAELTENKYRPLANKAVQGTYPPGSTFKMVTALAAIEAGVISANETIYCGGHTEVANRRFHCWKRGGHGKMDLHNSLKQSCDVYYYAGLQPAARSSRAWCALSMVRTCPQLWAHLWICPKHRSTISATPCSPSATSSAARPMAPASPIKTAAWPAKQAPAKCATSPPRSAAQGSFATKTSHGSAATTRCLWATRPMTTRATPSRWWWSMAAAALRRRPPSRATSFWPRSLTGCRPCPPILNRSAPASNPRSKSCRSMIQKTAQRSLRHDISCP